MRKILISKGYGAGWSSWMTGVPTSFACEYKPLIEAIESRENITEDHPAIISFVKECQEKYDESPYLGGLDGLCIVQIEDNDKYRVEEYDGAESLTTLQTTEWC